MRANLSSVLTELADFTGFDIPNEKIEVKRKIFMQQREGLYAEMPLK